MDDKVNELVEWVAKEVYAKQYAHRHPPWELSWESEKQIYKDACYDLAKQILSHPDLALIDREKSLTIVIEALKAAEMRQGCTNYTPFAEGVLSQLLIPLAEALKDSHD